MALRDLLLISLAIAGMLWFGAVTDVFEGTQAWLRHRFRFAVDEILVGSILVSLGLALFSLLQWRSAWREATARDRAEVRFRTLVEKMPAVTYTWDATYRSGDAPTTYISPQVHRLLGYRPEEFEDPQLWHRLVHPDDKDRVLGEWERCERGDSAFRSEYRMRTSDGRIVWVRDEAVPVGRSEQGRPIFQGVMFDITERKAAEEKMGAAVARYRSLVDHLPLVTYLNDYRSDPEQRYISPGIRSLLGYTEEEWLADPHIWQSVVHPDDREWTLEEIRRTEASGEQRSLEYRMIAKDGRVVWVHDDARVVEHGPSPDRSVWQGVCMDITRRKEAELRLREAEETYRTLVEQLPVVVYQDAIDDLSTGLYISPQYQRMFGYSREVRLADPEFWVNHLHPDDRERVLEESRRTNETGDPFSIEYRYLGRDGVVWVRDEAVLLRDAEGRPKHWQGVLIDVTQAKVAEEALARRDAVLEATGFAAERFLKSPEWEAALPEVLERLGMASSASRVYVFENEILEDAGPGMRLLREWLNGEVPALDPAASEGLPYAKSYVRWQATLSAGRAIHGLTINFPAGERVGSLNEGVRSRVLVPVFAGDEWWGFLGFDDCERERTWPAPEIDALKTTADTLGAAIGRRPGRTRACRSPGRRSGARGADGRGPGLCPRGHRDNGRAGGGSSTSTRPPRTCSDTDATRSPASRSPMC